jgi:hypothetical protein
MYFFFVVVVEHLVQNKVDIIELAYRDAVVVGDFAEVDFYN